MMMLLGIIALCLSAVNSASTGGCSSGYYEQVGDLPGWTTVEGRGGGESVSSCDGCAALCTSFSTCLSYECSSSALKCNLNEQANPSKGAYGDYAFCTKKETTVDPTSMPTQEPTKNCDLLHIDEFLLDCSSEWEGARQMMEGVYSAAATNSLNIASNAANIANGTAVIATNAGNIASVASSVATNANNIASATAIVSTNADNIVTVTASAATNAADISSVDSSVAALQSKVAELEAILDQLAVNSAANAAAPMTYAHAGAWNVDESAGMADGAWNGVTVTGKDLGIVVLAVINLIMIAMMVIACKRSGGRTKYQPVAVGSDMEPINA